MTLNDPILAPIRVSVLLVSVCIMYSSATCLHGQRLIVIAQLAPDRKALGNHKWRRTVGIAVMRNAQLLMAQGQHIVIQERMTATNRCIWPRTKRAMRKLRQAQRSAMDYGAAKTVE